ncbi:DUF4089 domain-containing protein [Terrarubrum flagellatum]|uniref:DUF4089 domain-containing protein n=1 Tax=Terrirubrum flagellatum TaxID=2895980 RepID=UPI00314526C3
MKPEDIDIDAYIAVASAAIGLTIDPQYRDEVARQFGLLLRAAALVDGADGVTRLEEPAPIFTPGARG